MKDEQNDLVQSIKKQGHMPFRFTHDKVLKITKDAFAEHQRRLTHYEVLELIGQKREEQINGKSN